MQLTVNAVMASARLLYAFCFCRSHAIQHCDHTFWCGLLDIVISDLYNRFWFVALLVDIGKGFAFEFCVFGFCVITALLAGVLVSAKQTSDSKGVIFTHLGAVTAGITHSTATLTCTETQRGSG